MRFRNFIPLLLLIVFSLPPGLAFLFAWQGHAAVICGMQCFNILFFFLAYRAGINSARKNFVPRLTLGKIAYLPLKVNLVFYLLIGVPLIIVCAENLTVLWWGFVASLAGFSLAYTSGVTFVTRSAPTASIPP